MTTHVVPRGSDARDDCRVRRVGHRRVDTLDRFRVDAFTNHASEVGKLGAVGLGVQIEIGSQAVDGDEHDVVLRRERPRAG